MGCTVFAALLADEGEKQPNPSLYSLIKFGQVIACLGE